MPSLKLSNPFRQGADRPSLKERAAALKATAGRVMRRKPRTSAEALAAMAPYHEGFVPYPFAAPTHLLAIDLAIRSEAKRLLDLADAEFDRLYAEETASLDDDRCDAVGERLTGMLRLRALAEAADDTDPVPPVDWHSPPPGFMAHPAIEPTNFLTIRTGLRLEAERLHGIALAEFERQRAAFQPSIPGHTEADRSAHLRRVLRLDELAAAAYPERAARVSISMAPDPVLAAIDASRRIEAEMAAFQNATTAPDPVAWFARERALCDAQGEARNAVWRTVPTTATGRRALVEYARFQVRLHIGADGILDNAAALIEEIFAPIAAAVASVDCRGVPLGEGAADPAERGGDLTDPHKLTTAILDGWAAWSTHQDAMEAAYANGTLPEDEDGGNHPVDKRRYELLGAAEALPATWACALPKALALAWIVNVDIWRRGWSRENYATDGRLALDVHEAAVTAGADATHPDAALIALGLELDAAWAPEVEADRDCDAISGAARAAVRRPDCLILREEDEPFRLDPMSSGRTGEQVFPRDVGYLRDHVFRRGGQPWPEAQARAAEIVAAWDAWQEAQTAAEDRHGISEAKARCHEAAKEITAILERLATMPAHTAEGLRIKIRALWFGAMDVDADTPTGRVFRSLIQDAGVPETEITVEA